MTDPRWSVLARWIEDNCAMPCPWLVEVLRTGVVPGSVDVAVPFTHTGCPTGRHMSNGNCPCLTHSGDGALPPSALPGCQDDPPGEDL